MESAELKYDQDVTVLAWWNGGKPVHCKIGVVISDNQIYVRPMVGNPHTRLVKIADIVSQDGGACPKCSEQL